MENFQASLITPTGKAFEGAAEFLSAPGQAGSLGILAHHAPIVAMLKKGDVKIQTGGAQKIFAISTGFLEVDQAHHVLLLVDEAVEK